MVFIIIDLHICVGPLFCIGWFSPNDRITKAINIIINFNTVIDPNAVIWICTDQLDGNIIPIRILTEIVSDNIHMRDIGHILIEGSFKPVNLIRIPTRSAFFRCSPLRGNIVIEAPGR